jgi:hypothetical protein
MKAVLAIAHAYYYYAEVALVLIELCRLQPCMDFLLHLLGGSFSFCTKLPCPILLSGSGLKV